MAIKQRAFALGHDVRIRKALEAMGVDFDHVQRVVIDMPWEEIATIYIESMATANEVAEILEVIATGPELSVKVTKAEGATVA